MDLMKLHNLKALQIEDKAINDIQDINEISFDYSSSFNQRMITMLKKIDNPYIFKNGDVIVKRNFLDDSNITVKEIFENYQNLNSY